MAKVTKTVRLEESLLEKLAEIAEQEFDGNATAALEAFMEQGIALRKIPEHTRWGIYSRSNVWMLEDLDIVRGSKEEYEAINALTTVLYI